MQICIPILAIPRFIHVFFCFLFFLAETNASNTNCKATRTA